METIKELLLTLIGVYLALSADRRAWYKAKHRTNKEKPENK
ncbi:hypothetical protein [Corynebacterium lizhenjunii]|nr:hypothetical protein [Corynebacterium lizhenjunii]